MNWFKLLFSRKSSAVVVSICPIQQDELEKAHKAVKQHLSEKNEQLNHAITKKLDGRRKAYK